MSNMWKYITRNLRETFERRICSSLTDSSGQDKNSTCKFKDTFLPTIHTFCDKRNFYGLNNRASAFNDKRGERSHEHTWNDTYIRNNWWGAVGWSTALVLSWNLLQPLCRLQYIEKKERPQCPWSRHVSSSTRWGGAKGWHWKREASPHNRGESAHWPFVCRRSKRSLEDTNGFWDAKAKGWPWKREAGTRYRPGPAFVCPRSRSSSDQTDGFWDSGRHSYTGGHKTQNLPEEDEWDSGHHSQEHDKHTNSNAGDSIPLRAHHSSNYPGFWKVLTQTVWAQPTRIVAKPVKLEIDFKPTPEDRVNASYGPPTAEQALDEAAEKFVEAQNSVMGDIDNKIGVELMQQGKHHEAFSHFNRATDFNNSSAAYNLAVCYEMGLGTNQDFKKAAKFYQLASDKGHPTAMYNLGVFLVHGWGGLVTDTHEAQKLFEKASALGQSEAKKALDLVKPKEPSSPPLGQKGDSSLDLVQQAMELVKDLGLGFQDVSQSECVVNSTSDHKDISDMVHDSILKYTSMLQK